MQHYNSYGCSYVKRTKDRSHVALIWRHGRPIACTLPQPNYSAVAVAARALIRALPRL